MNAHTRVIVRDLGLQPYLAVWQAMQQFTNQRNHDTVDEFWLVEHPPVFTQGQNGNPEHLLSASDIPVVQSDRGGQVTYHGPGQLIVYTLIDLKRKKLNVREMISCLEQSVVRLLNNYSIQAHTECGAPGVYIQHQKICSVGLRVRRGCSFHGLALNIQMDMEPFLQINPCGFPALKMTQLAEWLNPLNIADIKTKLVKHLIDSLRYTSPHGDTDFKS